MGKRDRGHGEEGMRIRTGEEFSNGGKMIFLQLGTGQYKYW